MSINAPPSPIGGRTALQRAVENDHVDMVEFLLKLGANVNGPIVDQNGTTTLQAAARSRSLNVVELVLAVGADTSTPGGTTSALVIAIRQDDLPMFHLLLRHGVNVNTYPIENECSALQLAASKESTTFLQVLLSAGADVNEHWCRSGANATALQTALRSGRIDAVKLLLQAGADVNMNDKYGEDGGALLIAVQEGYFDGAKLLLQAGANVNPRAEAGHSKRRKHDSAIAEAASSLDIDMITLLLQYEADPNAIQGPEGHTALAGAITGSFEGGSADETIQLLLDAGAKVNARSSAIDIDTVVPGSILAVAAQSGSISVVRTLISSGADPNWRYSLEDWSALQCAITSDCKNEIVHIILEAGADINAPPSLQEGRTALQVAASQGNLELVELFLRMGAVVNAPAGKVRGVTALQAASIMGHLGVVICLLHAGANINSATSAIEGRTNLQGAAEMGRLDIVHLLLENDNDMEGFFDRCHDAATFASNRPHAIIAKTLRDYRKN